MKLIKKIMPAITLASVATITAPAVITSCSSVKSIELTNTQQTVGGVSKNVFGISGNFNKGTNYEFVGDVNKWSTDNGKPENEALWNKQNGLGIVIFKQNQSELKMDSIDGIKLISDGVELKKGTEQEVDAGTAVYCVKKIDTLGPNALMVMVKFDSTNVPIKFTSTFKLQNIKFSENSENVYLTVETIKVQ